MVVIAFCTTLTQQLGTLPGTSAVSLVVAAEAEVRPAPLAEHGTIPEPQPLTIAPSRLVAWCIVPFDSAKRSPLERARMLNDLGIGRLAYDYRAEHIPTFEAELDALKKHNIELTAWWFPGELNSEAQLILDVLKKHNVQTQLWVTGGGDPAATAELYRQRVIAEAARIRPIALAAKAIGCRVSLYNHGGWFGEPENQIAIIKELGLPNVGIVYNLHHGHSQIDRYRELLRTMLPHLDCLNLNGMVANGDQRGQKILPIGAGDLDAAIMRIILASGYTGPIGLLNHTDHDAKARLQDNLAGLNWVMRNVRTGFRGPEPTYQTYARPARTTPVAIDAPVVKHAPVEYRSDLVEQLVADAEKNGSAERGLRLFASHRLACLVCHKVDDIGGKVGPSLTPLALQRTPQQLVESVLWPDREVKPEYMTWAVITNDGELLRGFKRDEDDEKLILVDASTGAGTTLKKTEIDEITAAGTAMPAELLATRTPDQQSDLFQFLFSLRNTAGGTLTAEKRTERLQQFQLQHGHAAAAFPIDRKPLNPAAYPSWEAFINRERIYDFYTKQAGYFRDQQVRYETVAEFPGLDGGTLGHWGNQNEQSWASDAWNKTDLGSLLCGVIRADKTTVARGVCVRFGAANERAACFDLDTCAYRFVWKDDFLQFSPVRHGFIDPVRVKGEAEFLAPEPATTALPKRHYKGLYRFGKDVLFVTETASESASEEWVHTSEFDGGKPMFKAVPRNQFPNAEKLLGGPSQWPEEIAAVGTLGTGSPYAIDNIPLPTANPWNALTFVGGHAFSPNGNGYVATMQGDVWRVKGLTTPDGQPSDLKNVSWRRIASGLHQPLGVLFDADGLFVMCRDQLVRLVDLNGDEEADFYEAYSMAYKTSPTGHDFSCGLERDSEGRFYLSSGPQGLVRVSADGKSAEVLATGFRNPDGVGVLSDGTVTVPCSEGDWTPASQICAITPDMLATLSDTANAKPPFFGYPGPKDGQSIELPLVYLPRGVDNSAGGQTVVTSRRWGPLEGQALHFSFGTGTHHLLLRDQVGSRQQGAIVPLEGEFRSGAHRGRFNPVDGQLYVSGMNGWGSYTTDDGCFQRVRYTGAPVQLPTAFHVHENGILVTFSGPLEPEVAANPKAHFAQAWNYRFSGAYGSAEFALEEPQSAGHTVLEIASATVLPDGNTVFLELPDLQPVNQLHLSLAADSKHKVDVFLTVHVLDTPFTSLPGYRPCAKRIEPMPLLKDLRIATQSRRNPHRKAIDGAREITVSAGSNLAFQEREIAAKPGEAIKLVFKNPDVVPHNWALVKPGKLSEVGLAANKLISDPEAFARQYVPESEDVICFTDVVSAGSAFTIYFKVPSAPGRYPYLCTFPGHWMVMNGTLVVR